MLQVNYCVKKKPERSDFVQGLFGDIVKNLWNCMRILSYLFFHLFCLSHCMHTVKIHYKDDIIKITELFKKIQILLSKKI
jgi:hypothetical protein